MSVEENLLMGTITVGNRYLEEDLPRMFELFPRLKRAAQPAGDDPVRRRAADAGDRPRADEPAEAAAAGRAEPGLAPIVVRQISACCADPQRHDAVSGGAERQP